MRVKIFEYIVRHNEETLEDMIQSYISSIYDKEYIELKVNHVNNPVKVGETRYDLNDKSPRFQVIVTFDERKLTNEEINSIEEREDREYKLIIRKDADGNIIFKINGKRLDINEYFWTIDERVLYCNSWQGYHAVIEPILSFTGEYKNIYDKNFTINHISNKLIECIEKVAFKNEIIREFNTFY